MKPQPLSFLMENIQHLMRLMKLKRSIWTKYQKVFFQPNILGFATNLFRKSKKKIQTFQIYTNRITITYDFYTNNLLLDVLCGP
jgi:hypothetical protein